MLTLSRRWVDGQPYMRKVSGYDDAGRPTGEKITIPAAAQGVLGTTYETVMLYSYTGKLRDLQYKNANSGGKTIVPGETVTTLYNAFGLPDSTGSGLGEYVSATNYSAMGEVLRETYDAENSLNNLLLTNSYEEGTRRLERTIVDRETATAYRIADRNYSYDAAGNIRKVADTPEGGPSDIQCFAYDYLRRMTNAWTPSSGDCTAPKSGSALGGAAPYWMSWTFDKTGNRLTQTKHGNVDSSSADDTVNTFTYPTGLDQPHTVSKVNTSGPNGTSEDTFGYDAAGNTTSRRISGDTQTLEYDVEGHVSKVRNADGKESTYLYDADGGRLIAREPSATTLYVFGQEVRLETGTSTPSWTRYYSHNGHVVAQRNSISGLKWLVTDHQGTEIAAVTAGNLAVASRRQTPFGEARGGVASWPNRHGFVGGTQEESGLTRVGARLYDSSTGRFLSADPVIDNNDPQQLNGYAYSNNSPVTYSDPTGLYSNCGPDGIKCGFNNAPHDSEQYKINERQNPGSKVGRALQQQQAAARQARAEAGISEAEYQDALKNAHRTKWDVIKDVAWEMLKDISGWNDIVDCFTKGDIWACGGLVMNLVPWGKVGKILEAGYKAVKAVVSMAKVIEKAQGLLRRVEKTAARAQEIAVDAMRKLGGKGAGCNSFMPGTKVLMADGSQKPIEHVKLGDQVKSTDPATGMSAPHVVVGTIIGQGKKHLVEVTVDTDGVKGDATGKVTATDGHPFWLPKQQAWARADQLRVGSILQTSEDALIEVIALRKWVASERVYNLTVDREHTYYVAAGSSSIFVHNCDDDFEDFAHGTDLASGRNIKANGLSEVASRENIYGSKAPGSLFTVPVDQSDIQAALDTAADWGKRHSRGQTCVIVCRLPRAVVSDLEGRGLLRRTDIPNQAVFHPDSFPVINKHKLGWYGPIT